MKMRDMVSLMPFLMPVLIVAIVLAHKCFMAALKYQAEQKNAVPHQLEQRLDDFALRLEKIERRMANLETIVLEREKDHDFERALGSPCPDAPAA